MNFCHYFKFFWRFRGIAADYGQLQQVIAKKNAFGRERGVGWFVV
jgi:hypothetical protein